MNITAENKEQFEKIENIISEKIPKQVANQIDHAQFGISSILRLKFKTPASHVESVPVLLPSTGISLLDIHSNALVCHLRDIIIEMTKSDKQSFNIKFIS